MRRARTLGWLLALTLTGCSGQIGEAGGAAAAAADRAADERSNDPDGVGPGEDGTDPDGVAPGEMPECTGDSRLLRPQVRRLTPLQHRNTLESAFGMTFADDALPNFEDANPTIGLANDPRKMGVTTVTIDSVYSSVRSVASTVTAQYPPVVDCLAAAGTQCFADVIDSVGLALWRRPVLDSERDELLAGVDAVALETGTRTEQMQFVLQALLMSPNMLYRTEIGDGPGELTQLSSYELASLLSYTLGERPPDAELIALADSDALRDPDTLQAQTERLMDDPRFADSLAAFLWDYLKLENIDDVPKADRYGLTFAARVALGESARATLMAKLRAPDADLMDVFRGQDFQMNAEAAAFFGSSDPALTGEHTAVTADDAQREGILSHPAFLAVHAGEGSTGIVKRGVFTLEQLLGFDLPDPPDNVSGVELADLPEFDPETTSSRELHEITHSRQARCASCHVAIDPAGFGYENWDPVGRFQLTEKQDVTIDASGEYTVGEETFAFLDSVDYVRVLADSPSMRSTVLLNYFTYAMGQSGDGCEVLEFDEAVSSEGDGLRALAGNIVQTASFGEREAELE